MSPPSPSWLHRALLWLAKSTPVQSLERWVNQYWFKGVKQPNEASAIVLDRQGLEDKVNEDDYEDMAFFYTLRDEESPVELSNKNTENLSHEYDSTSYSDSHDSEEAINDELQGYVERLLNTEEIPDHRDSHFLGAESIDYQAERSAEDNTLDPEFELDLSEASSQDRLFAAKDPPFGHSSVRPSSYLKNEPSAIPRVKLHDEDREKRRRRRARAKRRQERAKGLHNAGGDHHLNQGEKQHLLDSQDLEKRHSPNGDQKAINQWRRPPLRSRSKWERMGYAQMNDWQLYSPSSKALLFGSWFASLEALVEVSDNMHKDRTEFYELVAQHEDFSTFSATELDAWWFQLNRVDHFVTEYLFYQRTREHLQLSPLLSSQMTLDTQVQQEQDHRSTEMNTSAQRNHSSEEDKESAFLDQEAHRADILDVSDEIAVFHDEPEYSYDSLPTQGAPLSQFSFDYSIDYSVDRSITEDVVLKPLERRRRTKRIKTKRGSS